MSSEGDFQNIENKSIDVVEVERNTEESVEINHLDCNLEHNDVNGNQSKIIIII